MDKAFGRELTGFRLLTLRLCLCVTHTDEPNNLFPTACADTNSTPVDYLDDLHRESTERRYIGCVGNKEDEEQGAGCSQPPQNLS